jgi:hypothetical protein
MNRIAVVLAILLTAAAAFADDCDIAVQPAATLLLPYFEVDLHSGTVQTLFTVQNVSPQPQIAHVTLWTDWAYPAFSFSIFLTGYDVQGINLYDLFSKGLIAPPGGTSSATPPAQSNPPGTEPAASSANPNFFPNAGAACAQLPGALAPSLLADLQALFTVGKAPADQPGCGQLGNVHQHAIGYATIDVAATCTAAAATAGYFNTVLLYDNVLTGDSQIVVRDKGYAHGGPLVHIRAVPEGGPAGAVVAGGLPATFYERYTTLDRRQPLPARFAPRFIQGGAGGFETRITIWREGVVRGDAACKDYIRNASMPVAGVIRFDEHENATVITGPIFEAPPYAMPVLLSASSFSAYFPGSSTSGDPGGWMSLNLDNGSSAAHASQSWVSVSMLAAPTFATDATAAALGNGCSPPVRSAPPIRPTP